MNCRIDPLWQEYNRVPRGRGMNPTGPNTGAQVLESGLVHARGERIFETRLKPTVNIDPAAAAVHNISDDDLVNALSWPDIAQPL
ncbi:hypothetical protein [Edwardsiella anguillarum]|uniref:hypothetical protein n=1 Tax=Edwardsiella anguillarum TaxID=1821960 RepID=UPI003D81510F